MAQPARTIVTDVAVEVGVKAAVDGHAEGGPARSADQPSGPSVATYTASGRHRVQAARSCADRQPDLQAAIAGQAHAGDERRRGVRAGPRRVDALPGPHERHPVSCARASRTRAARGSWRRR